MAGITLAPMAIYVTGYLAQTGDPANPTRVMQANEVPQLVSVSPAYHQGSATYSPQLGHPVASYTGGSINY